jgi:SsrA-binding protein
MSARETAESGRKLVATNKKARHRFHILETVEAGLVLQGTEVKSLREGNCSLDEAFARPRGEELWILNMHIAPYAQGNRENHEPRRPRKLLLHRREIRQLKDRIEQKGHTLVPLSLYFKRGRAKLELGLARGKRVADQREDMRRRDAEREMRQELRRRR